MKTGVSRWTVNTVNDTRCNRGARPNYVKREAKAGAVIVRTNLGSLASVYVMDDMLWFQRLPSTIATLFASSAAGLGNVKCRTCRRVCSSPKHSTTFVRQTGLSQ